MMESSSRSMLGIMYSLIPFKKDHVKIWDIIPQDPAAFAKAQSEFVESLPELFKDRFVGFGTYDINRPNGLLWALLSGLILDDHLNF